MNKIGVLLLNLGSPNSPDVSDVRSYLREFLMDGRVLDAPFPIRWLVVNAFILPFRPKKSAEGYASIWTEDGSPLIVTSEKVRKAIDTEEVPVALGMNYGQPTIESALENLREARVDRLYIMPMYPHYAMSSYETVVVKTRAVMREMQYAPQVELLQPFYRDADYIEALYASAHPYLKKDFDQILFSFHGIPERHLRKTDPSHAHCLSTPDCCQTCHPAHATCYRHQCFQTVERFRERAGLNPDQVRTTFQSRLGRDPWLRPYTDMTLGSLPREGIRKILIICPAFVADCLETIEEIAGEGKEIFLRAGGEEFTHIPCLNTHPEWLQFLRRRIASFAGVEELTLAS
ncbi:MAG: ferrochelatase [Puniceicoccaceae bacterium]